MAELPRVTVAAEPPAAAALALAVRPGPQLDDRAATVADAVNDVLALLTREGAKGEPGEVARVPRASGDGGELLLLAGVGDASPSALRRAGAAIAGAARHCPTLAVMIDAAGAEPLRGLVDGLLLASYEFARKSRPEPRSLTEITVVTDQPSEQVRRAVVVASAAAFCRDLVNTPASEEFPDWLARSATALAEERGLGARVRDESALRAEGFRGILAVGAGSHRPPRLVELTWSPADAHRHVVLVGKGITFDSGGLSLKPAEAMASMKTDMAGGAAVIATMAALPELGVRARVTGLVPCAENLPGAAAQRPGDVIRHYDGRTVEVLNTDAEGRLVLADALAYAAARLRPDVVVDLATLTGAATLGLGKRHAALYATDDRLAAELEAASERSGERVWRMPLVADYRDGLDSPIADLANIATKSYSGGSILAALFLREFTAGLPWAHLDIAGPARADAAEHEVPKGGTGFGARLLLRWLEGTDPEGTESGGTACEGAAGPPGPQRSDR